MKRLENDLRQCGLRVTEQRLAVYDWLRKHPVHPTADVIWQSLLPDNPGLSLTTVHNPVKALAEHGLIRSLNIDASEQRFDGEPADHGHFHCRLCGEITDFPIDPEDVQEMLPKGFIPEQCDVFVRGLCAGCATGKN